MLLDLADNKELKMIEKIGQCGDGGKWTLYQDKDYKDYKEAPLGFKGTSQIGDRILDLDGKPIGKEELHEGTQFTDFMFGGIFSVKPIGDHFCGIVRIIHWSKLQK